MTPTTIQLEWLRPTDYKASYSYLVVAWQASTMVQSNGTANETYTFSGLTPGEQYNFEVFTVVEKVQSQTQSIASNTSETRLCFLTDSSSGSRRRGGQAKPLNFCGYIFPQNQLRPLMSRSQEAPGTSLSAGALRLGRWAPTPSSSTKTISWKHPTRTWTTAL